MELNLKLETAKMEITPIKYRDSINVELIGVDPSSLELNLEKIIENVGMNEVMDRLESIDVVNFFGENSLLNEMDPEKIFFWLKENKPELLNEQKFEPKEK